MKTAIKDILSLMRRLRECRALFLASTIVTALAQLSLVGTSLISVWISSRLFTGIHNPVFALFLLLFSLVILNSLASLLEVWWSHEVAYRILHNLRIHLYEAIKRIAPLGLKGKRTADVASASMSDAEQLEWFYAHTAATAICAIFSPSIFIAILYFLVGPIALIMALVVIAMIVFPLLLMSIQRKQGARLRDELVSLRIASLDALQGQRELRSLGMVAKQHEKIDEITVRVQSIKNWQTFRKAWENAFGVIATAAGSTTVLIVLTGRVLEGQMDPAILPIATVLASICTIPALTLVGMIGRLGEIGACARRVNTILESQDPIPASPDPSFKKIEGEKQALVAEKLDFSYDTVKVLENINIEVTPHKSVAIVGKSGAGKSTFANLSLRFLDVQKGSIRFDGLELRGYQSDEYRKRLALVPQDCHIFAGSVRKNLLLARREASDEQIWQALRGACIADLVTSLGGLDAQLGDRGASISGGERQRLGIARAFLRNPQLLVLDEPLANIDPFLEASIARNARDLREGCSTIVIAHRLASILIADHIVLLDDGHIVGQGSHKEMLKYPAYRELLGDQLKSSRQDF